MGDEPCTSMGSKSENQLPVPGAIRNKSLKKKIKCDGTCCCVPNCVSNLRKTLSSHFTNSPKIPNSGRLGYIGWVELTLHQMSTTEFFQSTLKVERRLILTPYQLLYPKLSSLQPTKPRPTHKCRERTDNVFRPIENAPNNAVKDKPEQT